MTEPTTHTVAVPGAVLTYDIREPETLLGVEPVIFPGDHGGFAANEWSPNNDSAEFAARLRGLLDE